MIFGFSKYSQPCINIHEQQLCQKIFSFKSIKFGNEFFDLEVRAIPWF